MLHQKPVVCSSCLDNAGKASLTQALFALGGKLVNTWTQDCTHLAMPTVKVTIKVRFALNPLAPVMCLNCMFIFFESLFLFYQTISALLCGCPIVKPVFFSELNTAVQQKLPPPNAERYSSKLLMLSEPCIDLCFVFFLASSQTLMSPA